MVKGLRTASAFEEIVWGIARDVLSRHFFGMRRRPPLGNPCSTDCPAKFLMGVGRLMNSKMPPFVGRAGSFRHRVGQNIAAIYLSLAEL